MTSSSTSTTSASRIFRTSPHPHRGIKNVHGTSCHTSSALQLLFHCFPEVTESLLQLAPICAEYYWIENYVRARAATYQERNCIIEETQSEKEGATNSSSPLEVRQDIECSIVQREFVYYLSWFFHQLAYCEDVLQISKDKARLVLETRRQQEVEGLNAKRRRKKKRSNNSNALKMSAFQRATIKDFKAKSRAGKLSMDDWELLVMAMKDTSHNIQYSVASSSNSTVERNKEVGGDEATYANHEDINSSKPINSNANTNDFTATANCSNSDINNNSIDPTFFYQYLSSYGAGFSQLTSNNHGTNRKNGSLAFDTNNVGDAAMVFRCLVGALETSVNDELSRLQGVLDKMAHTSRSNHNEGKVMDTELDVAQENHGSGPSEKQLLSLLKQIRLATQRSWSGTLVSRIVGTHSASTSTSFSSRDEVDPEKSRTTATITLQRTKINGNIERPLPVPFPLPVINRQDKSDGTALDQTNYFDNIEQAFHSVTIEPIPIRGYDWSELIQRGEVVEEQYVARHDENEIPIVEGESIVNGRCIAIEEIVRAECDDGTNDEETFTEYVEEENDIESSRSIACQTDFIGRDAGTQTLAEENTLLEVRSSHRQNEDENVEKSGGREVNGDAATLPAANLGVDKSSCYAAAVAALVMSNKRTPVASRPSRVRRPSLDITNSVESRDSCLQSDSFAGSDGNVSGMENGTLSGMEIDALPEEDVQEDDESKENEARSLPDSSSSEEESSVDSHVSSVKTDTSSEENNEEGDGESLSTRSSAIETPPDIDNLSLGSFTDSEPESDEKNVHDNSSLRVTVPAINIAHNEASNREERIETNDETDKHNQEGIEVGQPILHTSTIDIDESALLANGSGDGVFAGVLTAKDENENEMEMEVDPSDVSTAGIIYFDTDNDTGAIRCSVNGSTSSSTTTPTSSSSASTTSTSSYSSTDDSSSTDSSRSFSDGSSSSTSDDDYDNEDIDNPQQDVNTAEWITRKETRLCLPLPQSLIFHLKRFQYLATRGRVQKLAGTMDVPHRLNVRACCSDTTTMATATRHDINTSMKGKSNMSSCCYEYFLSGAIVHVDPREIEEDEDEFGSISEGHYVTLLHSPPSGATNTHVNDPNHVEIEEEVGAWTEIDDDMIRIVNSDSEQSAHRHTALDAICGCNNFNDAASNTNRNDEYRYAMLLVYSRNCQCATRISIVDATGYSV